MRFDNLTTLCYLKRDGKILFIVKKGKNDLNEGKYLGVGGHMEKGESPYECIVREIYEETGIRADDIKDLKQRGMITFINDSCDDEYMHVFDGEYAGGYEPQGKDFGEGELIWIDKKDILSLPVWEGDKIMFRKLLDEDGFFSMKLVYSADTLKHVEIY